MNKFDSFHGIITMIDDFLIDATGENLACYKLITVENSGNTVNFVVAPCTYFVNHEMVSVGDMVTGYYDANAPVPLIFPPRFRAIVMAKDNLYENVKVDYFGSELISSDNKLKLTISPYTRLVLENGQAFTGNPTNRNLIVIYGASTKSIPAITAPYRIIVMC